MVVTKVLGGFFVSSESLLAALMSPVERGHEIVLLSLENFRGRFVFTQKVLGDLFSTTIVMSW